MDRVKVPSEGGPGPQIIIRGGIPWSPLVYVSVKVFYLGCTVDPETDGGNRDVEGVERTTVSLWSMT